MSTADLAGEMEHLEQENRTLQAERDRYRRALERVAFEQYEGTRLTRDEVDYVARAALSEEPE